MSNIAEGFRQRTDRAFARYLGISSGSSEESRTHLRAAAMRGQITETRCREMTDEAREIGHMLEGLIRYLRRCDRKDRFL